MDVFQAISARQSHRDYTSDLVPRDIVKQLIECARWAPSSCNLQLTEYIVIDDPALLVRLAKEASHKFSWGSTFILFLYDPRFSVKRSAHLVSLGGAMENILLVATELGLSACPMAGFKNDETIKRILHIPAFYELGLLMSIGYPKHPSVKKDRLRLPLERMMHWNGFERSGAIAQTSLDPDDWSMPDLMNYRERLAPVYLYNDHFRLHSYADAVYQNIAKKFVVRFSSANTWIDLATYDGLFFSQAYGHLPKVRVTIADHVSYVLEVIAKRFPVQAQTMDHCHRTVSSDGSYNVASCVHKLEFNPDPSGLLQEAGRLLHSGGALFVTTSQERWIKRYAKRMQRWKRQWVNHEIVNVYENNPFYKIGPMKQRTPAQIKTWAEAASLSLESSGYETVLGSGTVPHTYYWAIYKKN